MSTCPRPLDRTHTDTLLGDGWSWEDEDAFSPGLPDGDLMALVDELTASMAAGIPETVSPETDGRWATGRAHPPGTRRVGGLARSAWVYPMDPEPDTIVDFLDDVGAGDTSSVRDTLAAAARLSARLQRRLADQRGASPRLPAARADTRWGSGSDRAQEGGGIRRAAVERRGPVRTATPSPDAPAPTPAPTRGHAQPCDLSAWSTGLYGVFLPERRKLQESIGFSDRRSA